MILGSSRGIRRLDASRSMPTSLQTVDPSGTVLDWTLHALSRHGITATTYVGGYQIQKVIERYPDLSCRYHSAWQREGELAALLKYIPRQTYSCFVLRSATLILPEALERIAETTGQVAVGYYEPQAGQEFAGIVMVRASCLEESYAVAEELVAGDRRASMEQWVEALAERGLGIAKTDLDGLVSSVTEPLALARTLFSSKAQTLARIRPMVKRASVLDQVSFKAHDWIAGPESVLADVKASFGDVRVVVRSSAQSEDGLHESLAGRFRTVLDVRADDGPGLRRAIDDVIRSYVSDGRDLQPADEVFVQPQMSDLAASGVLLTRDPESGAPYYVLNIDRQSGRSDTVTSGSQNAFDTVYVSRQADLSRLPKDVGTWVAIARELEELMHLDSLDIELGIDRSGSPYVFQVRPLPARARKFELADEDLEEESERVREFLKGHMRPHPHLYGSTTLFSTMSDWNPAEMIGTTPRPLAISLYQKLIGDTSWAEARAQIGHMDVRPEPLIVAIGGRPYVDVRASLNSFLPADLEPEVAERWVEHGLSRLQQDPRLHDKIEFEVALPCLTFDAQNDAARMAEAGLTEAESTVFRSRLLALTDRTISGKCNSIDEQLGLVAKLEPRRARTLAAQEPDATGMARQIHYLLEDCRRYGVVPFSVLARYAFVSIALLRSLREMEVFSDEEFEAILRSIPTVATELSRDLALRASGEIDKDEFLARYGHLRPSSYDITSPNYGAALELYLRRNGDAPSASDGANSRQAKQLFEDREGAIDRLLHDRGFTARPFQVRDFILGAIPARERAKFEFMKNVDAILELSAQLGSEFGLDREDVSFLPIDRIASGATDSPTGAAQTQLKREIEFAKKRWNLTCVIRLPHLVRDPDDVNGFQLEEWTPNFVSSQRVVAAPVVLDGPLPPTELDGRIVMIRAADPGYDWLFSYAIAGLVTQYGGVASHMAIRAAEFGLPAAIGCGELIFERLRDARLVELDCVNRRVHPIQ